MGYDKRLLSRHVASAFDGQLVDEQRMQLAAIVVCSLFSGLRCSEKPVVTSMGLDSLIFAEEQPFRD